jgi:hypothetical protein
MGLHWCLRAAGYRVLNIGYPSRRITISQAVNDYLAPALASLEIQEGTRVHFVTHSLGGIVFRAWAQDRDPAFPLGRTVMLAPPNQGSEILAYLSQRRWVNLLLGPVVRELQTDPGCTPRRLGAVPAGTAVIMGNQPKIRLFLHLFSDASDGIVPVQGGEVAGLDGFLVVAADHTFIMWRPVVLRAVRHFLQHGTFRGSAFSAYEANDFLDAGLDAGGDGAVRRRGETA